MYNKFKKFGPTCKICNRNNLAASQRHSQEYIKNYLNDFNFELVDVYVNMSTPIKIICPNKHICNMTFINFKRGHRCIECAGNRKKSIDAVQTIFKDAGCKLISTEYCGNKQPLTYICSCGNESKISLNSFQRGNRCRLCANKKISIRNSKERHYRYNPDRNQLKLNKKIRNLSQDLIRSCINLTGQQKHTKTEELLKYTRFEFLTYIQKDDNFENWKKDSYNWHIDHIWPKIAFINEGITDLSIINSLDNLRIISKNDNLSKGDKYDKNKFLEYLRNKNIK
jgi:hypothetical protein